MFTPPDMTPAEIETELRRRFKADLPGKVERYAKSRVHSQIPSEFFASASSECRNHFVDGNYYGCITLAQSVAEGLARFVAQRAGLRVVEDYHAQINILQDKNGPGRAISTAGFQAFRLIHANDRNDFHHLDVNIEQDRQLLEARALECVEALYTIESEVFAFDVKEGIICPKQRRFWPKPTPEGFVRVFVR